MPATSTPRRPRGGNITPKMWSAKLLTGQVTLSPMQEQILACLTQHRLMTTQQLHTLVAADYRREFLHRNLQRLAAAELAASTPVQHERNAKAWWVTPAGRARVAAALRPRAYVMTAGRADSNLQSHTLLANQIGVEFVRHGRARNVPISYLDWDNEIGHRVRDGESEASNLVSDLRIRFVLTDDADGDSGVVCLIEADRGTETVLALTEKIRNYTRLLTYIPLEARRAGDTVPNWRRHYRRFPRVLIVFADKAQSTLERRAEQLLGFCAEDPYINQHLDRLGLLCTTMTQLTDHGPFEPIFWDAYGHNVNLLGTAPKRRTSGRST
ncbi:replication-relaxation family protein [Kutzneria buriramensis]|uniref:Protein involved in plasmid replication-relaxation n=1 Tax=Kutzneria buriramensis TaxID=1045776 RepID=A0A3E0GWG0_9PSEU|nr:replication-relaxation family protein [Kutzneria buriramensis]REH31015.1 protein involved in plasmid replication-relaxation [Kutzneria buriramensis]